MGKGDLRGNESSKGNGFDKRPDLINKKGAMPSFKRKFMELSEKEGGKVLIPEKDVKRIERDNGIFYSFNMPTMDALVLRLMTIAKGGKSNDALNAIKYLWDQFDGKAKQTIDLNLPEMPKYDLTKLNDEQFKLWEELLEIVRITEQT